MTLVFYIPIIFNGGFNCVAVLMEPKGGTDKSTILKKYLFYEIFLY